MNSRNATETDQKKISNQAEAAMAENKAQAATMVSPSSATQKRVQDSSALSMSCLSTSAFSFVLEAY